MEFNAAALDAFYAAGSDYSSDEGPYGPGDGLNATIMHQVEMAELAEQELVATTNGPGADGVAVPMVEEGHTGGAAAGGDESYGPGAKREGTGVEVVGVEGIGDGASNDGRHPSLEDTGGDGSMREANIP